MIGGQHFGNYGNEIGVNYSIMLP